MLTIGVCTEGDHHSKEKTLLNLLSGCNLLSNQFIPSSSSIIAGKNIEIGEHWELMFRTESDQLKAREIIQMQTDIYTIIQKEQMNNSNKEEDQDEGEEEYEIIWSHQSEGNNGHASSGTDKLKEDPIEEEQKEKDILSDQQKENIPQVDQVFNELDGNLGNQLNQCEQDDNQCSANLEIDQQINSIENCAHKVDSQPEQQLENHSENQKEQHQMFDSVLNSSEIFTRPEEEQKQEEANKNDLKTDVVQNTQQELEFQQQQIIQERIILVDHDQLQNLMNVTEQNQQQQQQSSQLLNQDNLKEGQKKQIKENNNNNHNPKKDQVQSLLNFKNIINYSYYPIILIGLIYLCYLLLAK